MTLKSSAVGSPNAAYLQGMLLDLEAAEALRCGCLGHSQQGSDTSQYALLPLCTSRCCLATQAAASPTQNLCQQSHAL